MSIAAVPFLFYMSLYQAGGGSGTLLSGLAAGLLRRERKPTTIGMAMKITDKQMKTKPKVGGNVPELLTPFTSVL